MHWTSWKIRKLPSRTHNPVSKTIDPMYNHSLYSISFIDINWITLLIASTQILISRVMDMPTKQMYNWQRYQWHLFWMMFPIMMGTAWCNSRGWIISSDWPQGTPPYVGSNSCLGNGTWHMAPWYVMCGSVPVVLPKSQCRTAEWSNPWIIHREPHIWENNQTSTY